MAGLSWSLGSLGKSERWAAMANTSGIPCKELSASDVVELLATCMKESSTAATQFIAGFVVYVGINGALLLGVHHVLVEPTSAFASLGPTLLRALCILGIAAAL